MGSEHHRTYSAVVELTVRVDVSDSWGGDATMDQIIRQAEEGAALEVRKALTGPEGAPHSRISAGRVLQVLVSEVKR